MTDLVSMSSRQYAEASDPVLGKFEVVGEPFALYLHAGCRLAVQCERHSMIGFGYDRFDAIDETYDCHGKTAAERDAEEFASDFVNLFCDHLSLRQLNTLIPELIKLRDKMIAERAAFSAQHRKEA